QRVVVVLVRVPVGAVLPLVERGARVVVRHVVMVVAVGHRRMRVRGLFAFPFGLLSDHPAYSFPNRAALRSPVAARLTIAPVAEAPRLIEPLGERQPRGRRPLEAPQ